MDDGGDFQLQCPIPLDDYPRVLLAHGGGGRLMHRLLDDLILPVLGAGAGGHDASIIDTGAHTAMTTDSFVVQPLCFPGGDIGSLAVHGTVNDLAMSGARPRYLSVGLILEEGLDMALLWRLLCSMRAAADACSVRIVTGDTKVVDRGKGDGLYVNTAGVGELSPGLDIHPRRIEPGDAVIVSGDLGRHGMAIMASREELNLESPIESDSAELATAVAALLDAGVAVHCLRDLTRGGLASALNELAASAGAGIEIEDASVPVDPLVASACEVLGLDPLYVACEGRMVAIVPEAEAERTVELLRAHAPGGGAERVGKVMATGRARVTLRSRIGARRVLDMLSGEQLPRIC